LTSSFLIDNTPGVIIYIILHLLLNIKVTLKVWVVCAGAEHKLEGQFSLATLWRKNRQKLLPMLIKLNVSWQAL